MMNAIVVDGRQRLLEAVAAEVQRKFAAELAAARNSIERAAIEAKIQLETKARQKRVPSHANWLIR